MACSNAAGTHEIPLILIEKSAKPRSFKNINLISLPVYCRNPKKCVQGSKFVWGMVPWAVCALSREIICEEDDLSSRAIHFIDNAQKTSGHWKNFEWWN